MKMRLRRGLKLARLAQIYRTERHQYIIPSAMARCKTLIPVKMYILLNLTFKANVDYIQ